MRYQIRYSPESTQWAVIKEVLHTEPQRRSQSVCAIPVFQRWQVEPELQLAQQRLELQQSGCASRNSLYFSPLSGEFFFFN